MGSTDITDPQCVRSTKGDDPQRVGLRSFLKEKIVSEYEHYTCAHKSRKISYLDLTIIYVFWPAQRVTFDNGPSSFEQSLVVARLSSADTIKHRHTAASTNRGIVIKFLPIPWASRPFYSHNYLVHISIVWRWWIGHLFAPVGSPVSPWEHGLIDGLDSTCRWKEATCILRS